MRLLIVEDEEDMQAVSYTHLDVYKRQGNGPVELYPAASDGKSKYAALSERALLEYQKWEVTLQNDTLLYRGEPIRIFMDLRANNSFV